MALIDKASLLMVPSTYEDGTLYNVLPSGNKAPDETGNHNGYDQTRADFTFSRGSNLAATRVNANGLIEKGRENLLLQSNQFDTTWVNNLGSGGSITSGQSGYDGTNNAWLISKSAAFGRIDQSVSSSGVQTYSVYAKANASNWVYFRADYSGGVVSGYFDLVNGVGGSFGNQIDAKIESAGNGWYRIQLVFNQTITIVRIYPAEENNQTGGTTGSIYIQDAQLEAGLVATDYIETGSVSGTAGVLENTPRIDYSSGAGALLLEPQRTNLITHSEYFDNWTKVDTTLTYNYGISPEGIRNSTRVQFADDTAYMYIAPGGTSSGTYASSIYIKGTAGETIKFGKGGNVASGAMHTLNGDWQRIEHITTDVGLSVHLSTYGGSTARDMEIYGCQLEAGSHASSYVPTYGSAATRGADSCSVTGASDVIGQTEGTLFVEASAIDNESTNKRISLSDGTNANRVTLNFGLNQVGFVVVVSNVASLSTTYTISPNANHKIALAYKQNDFVAYIDGVQVLTDNSGATFSGALNSFRFSDGQSGLSLFAGDTKQAALFKERLSNAELAALTA